METINMINGHPNLSFLLLCSSQISGYADAMQIKYYIITTTTIIIVIIITVLT